MIYGGAAYGALEFGGEQRSPGSAGTALPSGVSAVSAENNPLGIAVAKPSGVSATSAEHNPSATVPATPSGVTAASAVHQPLGSAIALAIGQSATSATNAPVAGLPGDAFDHNAFDSGAFDADAHPFDQNAFDSAAFDTGAVAQTVVAQTSEVVVGLTSASPSDGGFLVGTDLASIRGKFIYRNAPPDQDAYISLSGRTIGSTAGDVTASGEVNVDIAGVAARIGPARVNAWGNQVKSPAMLGSAAASMSANRLEAAGIVDISDEELLLILGELVA